MNTFPNLYKDEINVTEVPNHDVRLEIVTSGYYKRPFCYRLPEFYHVEAKEKVDNMLSQGILRASSSPYASPMVCAPKKDGTLRVCTDFRHLNDITIADRYVMPRIDDIKRSIRGHVFSTIDLREGFYQIPIEEPDIPKTAMSTPWGLFEYVRMPFGLKNAPATFQRFLNHVTHQLENVSVYIDDLIIFSNTVEEHFQHLFHLFERLSRFGLVINQEKSEFFVTQAKYLGVVFSSRGYHPDMEIIGPRLDQMPKPHDRKSMQKFLGLVNYVRQHIPNLAHLARPLYELVKKHVRFSWSNIHEAAYHKLITRCKQGIPLSPLFHDLPLDLHVDASSIAAGAVLLQKNRPIEFYSARFSPTEQRYSTHEREAYALFLACKHFRVVLVGRPFTVYTDHKPLLYLMSKEPPNERYARWIVRMQDLQFNVKYIEGKDNVLADMMSRPEGVVKSSLQEMHQVRVSEISSHLFDVMKVAELQTPEFLASCNIPKEFIEKTGSAYFNVVWGRPCLILPFEFRQQIMEAVHNSSHYGNKRTFRAIAQSYWWPKMGKDINEFVMNCEVCQRNKAGRRLSRPWVKFPQTSRMKTIHIDIVGPFPPSPTGKRFILTIIDRFTRWMEAVPLANITAEIVAKQFFSTWVSRYGVPEAVISDQGAQFESYIFNRMLS